VSAIGWDEIRELESFKTVDAVKRALARSYPAESKRTLGIWAGELWRFAHKIQAGDLIITPHQDRRFLHLGIDQGIYRYRKDFPAGTRHTRRVTWEPSSIRRTDLPRDIARSLSSWLTVARVRRSKAAERVMGFMPSLMGTAGLSQPPYDIKRILLTTRAVIAVDTSIGSGSLPPLTPRYLNNELIPFFEALNHLNQAILSPFELEAPDLSIMSLRQLSPVEVSFKGTARETLEVFRDELVPWRRKRAQREAELEERKQRAEAEAKEAQTDEARQRVETIRIENDKARFELRREKLDYAMELATRLHPNATPVERMQIALHVNAALDATSKTDLTVSLP